MAKLSFFILAIWLVCSSLLAQDISITPWQFLRHSAIDSNQSMHVKCESAPGILGYQMSLFANTGTGWTEYSMSNSNTTYTAEITAEESQDIRIRMKAHNDSLSYLQPAYIDSNSLPAYNALAEVTTDPNGDSQIAESPNLDITSYGIGYNTTKIFAGIQNVSGGFPTSEGILGPYNLYIAILANPEVVFADTIVYAMVYANVPLVLSPGLYKVTNPLSNFGFTRIGSIDSHMSNNQLVLSCNWQDLINDSDFGTWPNTGNMLGLEIVTAQMNISAQASFGDYSMPSMVNFDNLLIPAHVNTLPVLSDLQITSSSNSTTFTVTYTDADGDFPLFAAVCIDREMDYYMSPVTLNFNSPVVYSVTIPNTEIGAGVITFSDNMSDFVSLELSVANTEEEVAPKNNFSLYPNPWNKNNGTITVAWDNTSKRQPSFKLFNIKGQCIQSWEITDKNANQQALTIDTAPLPVGIYLMQMSAGSTRMVKKVFVTK